MSRDHMVGGLLMPGRLARARGAVGLSQRALGFALQLGFEPQPAVSSIERGHSPGREAEVRRGLMRITAACRRCRWEREGLLQARLCGANQWWNRMWGWNVGNEVEFGWLLLESAPARLRGVLDAQRALLCGRGGLAWTAIEERFARVSPALLPAVGV